MPQTGAVGVRYRLCAKLRKTTTVGPLFVNQTQGQNKMPSAALVGHQSLLFLFDQMCTKVIFMMPNVATNKSLY